MLSLGSEDASSIGEDSESLDLSVELLQGSLEEVEVLISSADRTADSKLVV